MNAQYFTLVGLIFSLAGIIVFALGLIISRQQALDIGVSRIASEDDKKNIKLPHVLDELRESSFAIKGAVLLGIGFILQIFGSLTAL